MAQLYKGQVLDDGSFPAPSTMHEPHRPAPRVPDSSAPAPATINNAQVAQLARELESITSTVGQLGPAVAQMQELIAGQAAERGYADGMARAQAETQHHLMEAVAALTEAQMQRASAIVANEGAIADLAMKIARKVIGTAFTTDPDLVARVVRDTIAELEPSATLVVHVHPEDLAAVEGRRAELDRLVNGRGAVELRADDSVDRGGCLLVSPAGQVDARIDTKLSVLETAFAAQQRQVQED